MFNRKVSASKPATILILDRYNMKTKYILYIIILLGTSCSSNKSLVTNYLKAKNECNFDSMSKLLNENYYEQFLNDSILEIKNLDHLKDFTEWGCIMSSNVEMKNISSSKTKVKTIEQHTNLIDSILNRNPRVFQITYYIENNKIKYSRIDTLSGYRKNALQGKLALDKFKSFVLKNSIDDGNGIEKEDAVKLKNALLYYQNTVINNSNK